MNKFSCLGMVLAATVPLADAAAEDMPLKSLSLFNSGMGCFLREGTVNGDKDITLNFKEAEINDLLKSLVIADLNNGKIEGIRYSSREPVSKTLGTFTIDLSKPAGLPDLLQQARGQEVEVTTDIAYKGIILSSEYRGIGGKQGETAFLNITADSQIYSIPFKDIRSVRFTDAKINKELSSALELIASAGNSDKKTVTIACRGKGSRTIRAMYSTETPVWKMSYRLVIGNDSAHTLQGWAIVENTTEEDWKDLSLELVSGNPVAFGMDLYEPLYNSRPVLPYSTGKHIDAKLYDEGMGGAEYAMESAADMDLAMREEMQMPMKRQSASRASGKIMMDAIDNKAINSSVNTAATAQDVGQFFSYKIKDNVSLERQKSAMLPVVNGNIEGERIVIYNENAMSKNPLNAIMLTNNSGVHLAPGPISVYEDGIWAGDARINSIAPGGKRLISFSADNGTEVLQLDKNLPEEIEEITIRNGLLYASRILRKEKTYTVIRRSDKKPSAARLFIEHASNAGWKLKSPSSFEERTENLYRFAIKMPSGKDAKTTLTVSEEYPVTRSTALTNIDSETIAFYCSQKNISSKSKASLEKLSKMKGELSDIANNKRSVEEKLKLLREDQERIRGNMEALSQTSELYNKYAKTLATQETQIEELMEKMNSLQNQEAAKKKEINGYIKSM